MDKKFNWQSFISIGLLFSFIIMFFSGVILYIAPEGSLSRWIGWHVFGLSKKQWEYQHTIFSYVFILFTVFHIFKINWVLLISYFKLNNVRFRALKEIIIALLITLLVFVGTLQNWSPFQFIMKTGSEISESFGKDANMLSIPDADKLNLEDFSLQALQIEYGEMERMLQEHGFKNIKKDIKISEFCEKNNTTPKLLYLLLISEKK